MTTKIWDGFRTTNWSKTSFISHGKLQCFFQQQTYTCQTKPTLEVSASDIRRNDDTWYMNDHQICKLKCRCCFFAKFIHLDLRRQEVEFVPYGSNLRSVKTALQILWHHTKQLRWFVRNIPGNSGNHGLSFDFIEHCATGGQILLGKGPSSKKNGGTLRPDVSETPHVSSLSMYFGAGTLIEGPVFKIRNAHLHRCCRIHGF